MSTDDLSTDDQHETGDMRQVIAALLIEVRLQREQQQRLLYRVEILTLALTEIFREFGTDAAGLLTPLPRRVHDRSAEFYQRRQQPDELPTQEDALLLLNEILDALRPKEDPPA